ncbi:MAG: hypothetical protein WA110_01460, partial [Anaerolineaceae bacterium]
MGKVITGRRLQWQVQDQVGRGDAGEVMRVQTELRQEQGLMKRPVQNVSAGTILRQAIQIENEGKILAALQGLQVSRNNLAVHTPILLDQSIQGTTQTAALFIVSEEVKGMPISNLLKQLHQEKISISQVLVLKVLSSLFLLLSKVHERGIAWNDVKMEHIFWDANSNTLSFIDWGNGLFFDTTQPLNGQSPEMLDYQQLISEGNLLLNQIAPELIPEIGWPADLTSLSKMELVHLQHRVEYMESYLSMRVTEYQLLFRKNLQKIMDLASLRELFELKNALERLGVEVDRPAMLNSTRQLALIYTQKHNYSSLQELIRLVREYLPQDFGDVWKMAEYLLTLKDADTSPIFSGLLTAVLNAEWSQAIWLLQSVYDQSKNVPQLINIQLAMRKAAIIPPVMQVMLFDQLKDLHDDAHLALIRLHVQNNAPEAEVSALESFSAGLDQVLKTWQVLEQGELLGDKLLTLRSLFSSTATAYLKIPANLLQSLNTLLTKTREVFLSWSEGDLVKTRQALVGMFLLEPSLTYLPKIHSGITDLEAWMERLSVGPMPGVSIT